MINFKSKIEEIPKIKSSHIKGLHHLGILTIHDLFFHFPFRYEDYSQISPISEVIPGEQATIIGKIISVKSRQSWKRRRMQITEAQIEDESGKIKAIWFNQRYLSGMLKSGKELRLSGKVSLGTNELSLSNPAWEFSSRDATHTGRLVPIYPETNGITSKWLRWRLSDFWKEVSSIKDPIPADILQKLNLPELKKALQYIHFPRTQTEYLIAQKRFAFQEMLLVQIKTIQIKSSWEKESSIIIKKNDEALEKFLLSLPFELTGAQKKSSAQILNDLGKPHPMNRLLNGDVGSGKTVVAALASLQVALSHFQTTIMAPTEVLAYQHFQEFCKLFPEDDIVIALLTNSYQLISQKGLQRKIKRENLIKKISSGDAHIIIGTHALIQKDVRFKNLALVIIDEQHRFGVNQRAHLQQQASEINDGLPGKIPHFLTMTATPIPRTLSLAFFGNLDISLLDEMPKNRKPVITKIIPATKRIGAYGFIRKEIKKGRQAFVILPLVEESKAMSEVKAAITEHTKLAEKIFPNLNVGLLHGRLKSQEKENVMSDFKDGIIQILVATSVVEVGVDVPNASIMIIEDADRFGLSQLHQFRGRIGRDKHQSYCLLFSRNSSTRLKAMEKFTDGFKIAETDLRLRGPGEFFGTRQSGLPDIAMENIANLKLIQISRKEAEKIIKIDPELKKNVLLKKELEVFEKSIHLE